MDKKECLGCQTSFQQGQKLIMENLITQYKNYQLPLKDEKSKWVILKTIVSFLNCKGGTIYIGVEDNEGAVVGLYLQRKDRDTFKLYMKHLMEKIYPKVDLNNKQEVVIQYIPVFREKNFEGKYVVKMIVQQGDNSQTYCIAEKIKLEASNSKIEQFEIFYAYFRHNMGGTQQYKGHKLLQEIHNRAKHPVQVSSTFHQNCNPQPPHLEIQIRTLTFSNIAEHQSARILDMFDQALKILNIDTSIDYSPDRKLIEIVVQDEDQFKQAKEYIVKNIDYLNQFLEDIVFEVKGQIHTYFHIQNIYKQNNKKKEDRKIEKDVKKQGVKFPYAAKTVSPKKENVKYQIPKMKEDRKIQESPNRFIKKYNITFTHIEPSSIAQLESFLRNSVCKEIQKHFLHYVNTLQMFLPSEHDLMKCFQVITTKQNSLSGFGFHQQIRWGTNLSLLRICNYDKNKKNQLVSYLIDFMGKNLKDINFSKEGGKFSLCCQMKDNRTTCEWLDILLKDRPFKKYRIPGSGRDTAKIKVYLQVRA